MDPIAHTLVGATLAQTSLRKLTPLATATLIIAANLPDVDAIATFLGSDASLFLRRGLSHGIIATALLPLLLATAVLVYDRRVRLRKDGNKSPVRFGGLLVLAYLGLFSHLFLDWLNTYGIRLLMPFSGRWFYGDTLFIIDAWMWLLMAASAVLAYSRSKRSLVLWLILASAASALITFTALVPLGAKIVWWMGVITLGVLRTRIIHPPYQRVALSCLGIFCVYLSFLAYGSRSIQKDVRSLVKAETGQEVIDIMSGPVPANPFARELIVETATHYLGYRAQLWGEAAISPLFAPQAIQEPDEAIQAALASPEIKGFVQWMRFPVYEKRETPGGTLVIIRDLRYVRPDAEPGMGIGIASVLVSAYR